MSGSHSYLTHAFGTGKNFPKECFDRYVDNKNRLTEIRIDYMIPRENKIVISSRYSETRFFTKISKLPRALPEEILRFEGKSEVLNEERIKLSVSRFD